ncbi:hypothetical protein BJY16_003842 [Actinoplanes octamycinicus]|uniref:Uncharacterized protein n=1 Tax=Actinoplanes octamycinicus TaxID=135948 RepID=A0A7W7GY24_9ACTN|nr:DUF5988 family protein [Actinoplanes octamycinicus]MBB4740383.1 hypothetical protein [Actinoplanes octamycinicus]
MSDTTSRLPQSARNVAGEAFLQARLEGGPADFPADLRDQAVPRDQDRVKVPYCGGYEHFERSAGDVEPVAFRWVGRTWVAE